MSLPSLLARFVSAGAFVCLLASAAAAPAHRDALAGRTPLRVFTTTRREKHFDLMPGEWLLCSSRRGLWMPYLWPGETELHFQKHGACVFALKNGKEGALLGVRLGTQTGRPELRSALRARCDPLTIWCVEEPGIDDVPDLPPGPYYALWAGTVSDLTRVSRLRPLKALHITCNLGVTDLSPLAELSELESLVLRCDDVADLRPLARLTKLEVLHIHNGHKVTDLSPLAALQGLRLLSIQGAESLTDLGPLARLPDLRVLVVEGPKVGDLAPLARLARLTWLGLRGCARVADLRPVARMPHLAYLDLAQCPAVADLGPLADLTDLEHLDLHGAAEVTDVAPLARLTRLRHLDLLGCRQVTDLWPLRRVCQTEPQRVWVEGPLRSRLLCLQRVSPSQINILMGGHYVTSARPPADGRCTWTNIVGRSVPLPAAYACGISRLFYPIRSGRPGTLLDFAWDGPRVTVSADGAPPRLAGILATTAEGRAALSRALVRARGPLVVWVDAASAAELPPLPAGADVTLVAAGLGVPLKSMARTRNLAGLHIQSCGTPVSDLRPIAHLTSLRLLVLPAGPRVTSLKHLARMTQLRTLTVPLAADLDDLGPLARLTQLQSLHLTCAKAPNLAPLAALPRLKTLRLDGDINGERLTGLGQLTRLESLSLDWHGHPCDFAALAQLRNLRALHLTDCRNVADLHPLASLGNLEVLTLRGCDRVADIAPVARLPRLRSLELDLCDGITDIGPLLALQRRGVHVTVDSRLGRQMAAEQPETPPPGLFMSPR